MPHSSGGGSSSGGIFRGYSSYAAPSYKGHSYRAADGSRYRRSLTYFPGATRYRYYYRGRNMYYYANMAPTSSSHGEIFIALIMIAVVIFLAVVPKLLYAGFFKLSLDYNSQIVVEDNLNRVKNKTELLNCFEEFKKKTGITPAFITVSYNDYTKVNASLEGYAKKAYLDRFSDEKHWLIVYSESSSGWEFHGMQGNDTDYILNVEITDRFNYVFHRSLSKGHSPDMAYVLALYDILPRLNTMLSFNVFIFLAVLIVIALFILPILDMTPKQKAMRNAVEAPEKKEKPMPVYMQKRGIDVNEQDTCSVCFNSYPKGMYEICPSCGTIFKKIVPKEEEPEKIDFYQSNKEEAKKTDFYSSDNEKDQTDHSFNSYYINND